MKRIVLPGELLLDKVTKLGTNVFTKDNNVYSSVLGIYNGSNDYISVIPLNGPYVPEINDAIVCVVKNVTNNGYIVDVNSHTNCFLPKSLITRELKIGQILFARVKAVVDNDVTELDNVNILPLGNIISVSSVKIPRIIGKNDSMLNVLKTHTQSNILVGKNGWIWFISKKENLLKNAINTIIENSQKSNLTNTIETYLKNNT